MSERAKRYDSTIARIAGNLLSGTLEAPELQGIGQREPLNNGYVLIVRGAVRVAREIVAEVERAEPAADPETRA